MAEQEAINWTKDFLAAEGSTSINVAAMVLRIRQKNLFTFLTEQNMLIKISGRYRPTSDFENLGYFTRIGRTTEVTNKGMYFLWTELKKHNIIPQF